ncbi:hypothetical protein, partial [Sulfurimonas sp. RIFOXYB12_FULL_35_9]|uniref:hypothetical protein n=1 Tax=Sulfurimonas sp. RIFOXYB12_FULL_35_9 TaxID=1802256 RepID=UPI0025E818F1
MTVSTTAFLEQDKVVSACATSAIWTLLSATPQISVENLPSPSAITKSGAHTQFDGSRTFPTSGMTQSQISRCLKHYGLEPTVISCSEKRLFNDLKESIYSYLSNDIPILIGGDIYEKKGKENKYL